MREPLTPYQIDRVNLQNELDQCHVFRNCINSREYFFNFYLSRIKEVEPNFIQSNGFCIVHNTPFENATPDNIKDLLKRVDDLRKQLNGIFDYNSKIVNQLAEYMVKVNPALPEGI